MNNKNLLYSAAKKNDEYFTKYEDIEKELKYYIDYNPEIFKNKIVYCPCDDFTKSQFTHYFINNFDKLELKAAISTCLAPHPNYQISFNEKINESDLHGRFLFQKKTGTITTGLLKSNGDFREKEITAIKEQADFIITNPPFSLLNEFLSWCINKNILLIAPLTFLGNLKPFEYIKNNKIHIGFNEIRYFNTPVGEKNVKCYWLTNLDPTPERPFIELTKTYNEFHYPFYDNLDAINVNSINEIPKDYNGKMGVPINFLPLYNPKQFNLCKIRYGYNNSHLLLNKQPIFNRVIIQKTPQAS